MYKLALVFVSSVFVAMSPAVAAGAQDKWVVTQLSGDARVIHPGLQPASLKVNSQIVSGDTLITGPTGRATLVRGADYIIVAPRSELRLPATPEQSGFTRVVEKLGTMLFKIQHTGIPHFAVDTPMLAAVVKGTTFSITVDQNRSAVQVIQGAVQVTAATGGMSKLVEGGRTVFVNHSEPKALLDADKPAPATPEPSSTAVRVSAADDNSLASVAQLTAGLVRVEADSPQPPVRMVASPEAASSVAPVPTTDTATATVSPAATPAVTVAGSTTPGVTTPSVTAAPVTVAASTPIVSVPGVSATTASTPVLVAPTVTAPTVTVASASTPTVTVPSVTAPTVTLPSVTVASVSTPTVTVPSVSTPTVSVPSISTPTVTIPTVTVASVSTPTVTVPSISTPTVTAPTISTPTVTVPAVTVPSVSTPVVSLPAVTTPAVTVPSVTIPCLLRC